MSKMETVERRCGVMADYVNRETLLKAVEKMDKLDKESTPYEYNKEGYILLIKNAPTADVAEVKHRNIDDEHCAICNSELDEKGTGGIWDLAGEICKALMLWNDHDEQDTVYNLIREYIERQEYCPNCGAKMDGGKEE